MPTVETQLRELAHHLDTEFTDVEVHELTPPGAPRPVRALRLDKPRLRRLPRWAVAVAAAVLVVIAVGGIAVLIPNLGGEPQPPVAPTDQSLVDVKFGDIPPFRATYSVSAFPEGTPATADISYGGPRRGFRLEAVQGRLDDMCEGGMSVWDGELLGEYIGCEAEEEFEVESTGSDFEPLAYLGWQTRGWTTDGGSWQEFCRSVDHEGLPVEVLAGRSALGIRCIGTRDDFRLWVDAETGLVLKLADSRGDSAWPADFEATTVEYDPAFASDAFLVEAPPGVTDSRLAPDAEEVTSSEEGPDTSGLTASDFSASLSGLGLTEGEVAPPFSGPLLTGTTFDLTELRGQPVLIMLWADWCPPCTDSLAPFQAVANQWADRVEFVSVLTLDSTPEFASGIVEEQGFTVPVVVDLTDNLWNALAIPAFVLLDAEGRAIAGLLGTAGDDPESAAQTLDFLLEQFLG